ncbi:putative flavonoid 3'-monooxygenase [Helianthus annuus]|nr:putative flavonoid 3'-monooxygenase [Helianthus annuus]KAJ0762384.1 putative flavonoid 3'-monooxygenase [Helianthus annuus]KAJ0928206.1 putative flavonoid 3'-monooxygenase [Helianthus annuus]
MVLLTLELQRITLSAVIHPFFSYKYPLFPLIFHHQTTPKNTHTLMATTHIDSLWLLALASKSKHTYSINLFLFITIFALACCVKILFQWARPGGPAWSKPNRKSTIPGPRGYPFIGSMHLMTGLAHRKLAAAANYCGASRLMAFSLGETRVVVTCNPEVAKDILNSSAFADRPVKESAYRLMFNRAIGFAPYGVYWRTLRRIAATHLFCPKQINVSERQRTVICSQMVEMLQNQKKTTSSVCVREVLKRASLSNMMWSVFGRKYRVDSNDVDSVELRKRVDEGYDLLGVLNWTDHLPWLSDFDLQGVRSRCSKLVPKVNRFVKRIIDEHRDQPSHVNSDFTDVLLSLDGSDKLSEPDMIAVLWEMIFRGTDTVAVLIEWILARLVLHPDVQQKVQEELDRVVGRSRAVTETDITSLVYLPAVVREVLRLHPPGPLLSWARLAITDTIIDGHHVPAGTTAMVNMWAITRDPQIWNGPLEFRPERFLNKTEGLMDMSVMGSDLRLAPFGSGRRSCPGKSLGLATVSFWVASLLQEFEFGRCDGYDVDLSEVLKLSCEMANPLCVTLRSRPRSTTLNREV